MPLLKPKDIQKMFEDMKLGTEEDRTRFREFEKLQTLKSNIKIFTRFASTTESEVSEGEVSDAKLA